MSTEDAFNEAVEVVAAILEATADPDLTWEGEAEVLLHALLSPSVTGEPSLVVLRGDLERVARAEILADDGWHYGESSEALYRLTPEGEKR